MAILRKQLYVKVYDSVLNWIIGHIVIVYAIEIILILVGCIYGIAGEHGFRACGY